MKNCENFLLILIFACCVLSRTNAQESIVIFAEISALSIPDFIDENCPYSDAYLIESPMTRKIVKRIMYALKERRPSRGYDGYTNKVYWNIAFTRSGSFRVDINTKERWLGRLLYRYLLAQKNQECFEWKKIEIYQNDSYYIRDDSYDDHNLAKRGSTDDFDFRPSVTDPAPYSSDRPDNRDTERVDDRRKNSDRFTRRYNLPELSRRSQTRENDSYPNNSEYYQNSAARTSSVIRDLSLPVPTRDGTIKEHVFENCTTYYQVAYVLNHAVQVQCKYRESKFFEIPDGFVYVTDIERIYEDGTAHSDRWTINQMKNNSHMGIIKRLSKNLVSAPKGKYRSFVFVIKINWKGVENVGHIKGFTGSTVRQDWLSQLGDNLLSREYRKRIFNSDSYSVYTFIYEFEKSEFEDDPILLSREYSNLSFNDHLNKSGLFQAIYNYP